jgi:hypothetical protein
MIEGMLVSIMFAMSSISRLWQRFRKKLGNPKLLCDTCMYDYPSACHNAKRPNATECPNYKKKR